MKIGIYQSYWGRVGGGQRYVGVVAQVLARHHDVEIVHYAEDFDRGAIEEALALDLSRVSFRQVPRRQHPQWPTSNPLARLRLERDWCRELSSPYDVFIDSSDTPPPFCHAGKGVLLTHFPLMTFEEFHGHDTEAWRRRPLPVRWMASWFHRLEWRRRLATYGLFLVNSDFTRQWIRRLWGLRAKVVYPPLRPGLRPGKKEPLIVTIGAFHHAQHKKHDVLIEAYKQLCDAGLAGWRYVLVGAAGTTDEDRRYVQRLRAAAGAYPIEIRTDVDGRQLRGLLGRASLVWHSMGYGVDAEHEPRRMEHFGMVATEAMAAGCVPVVFRGGGLPEIVSHAHNGFLWSTLDELRATTRQAADDPALLRSLAAAAVARSRDFGDEAFEARLLEALDPVVPQERGAGV